MTCNVNVWSAEYLRRDSKGATTHWLRATLVCHLWVVICLKTCWNWGDFQGLYWSEQHPPWVSSCLQAHFFLLTKVKLNLCQTSCECRAPVGWDLEDRKPARGKWRHRVLKKEFRKDTLAVQGRTVSLVCGEGCFRKTFLNCKIWSNECSFLSSFQKVG